MSKYSVIIPLYNKAPYIRKAFESVIAQTYRDFELVIVDDGSTDNSLQVVNEYMCDVSCMMSDVGDKIKVISQDNFGVAAARNNGVAASHGEFLCFLDADDWWEPIFLEGVDKLIAEYPDAGIYTTNYIYYKPGKTHVALNFPRGFINYPKAYLQSGAMPVTSITSCMRRKVFDEMGGFPMGIKFGEDFLLWAKTAIHYPVAFCEEPLAWYNNDVPASLRATRNLHAPEYHMLFHLDLIEAELSTLNIIHDTSAWYQLLDKLRVTGMLSYWLSDKYHDMAADELSKVDWSRQPKKIVHLYKTPIWILKVKQCFMQVGSWCKQKII